MEGLMTGRIIPGRSDAGCFINQDADLGGRNNILLIWTLYIVRRTDV